MGCKDDKNDNVFRDVVRDATEDFITYFDGWKHKLHNDLVKLFRGVAEKFDKEYLTEDKVESEGRRHALSLLLGEVKEVEEALEVVKTGVEHLNSAKCGSETSGT
jgi:hypothetical protein